MVNHLVALPGQRSLEQDIWNRLEEEDGELSEAWSEWAAENVEPEDLNYLFSSLHSLSTNSERTKKLLQAVEAVDSSMCTALVNFLTYMKGEKQNFLQEKARQIISNRG